MASKCRYKVGDQVEVYSASAGGWCPGAVVETADKDITIDGYGVPAGAVKVSYATAAGALSKWVLVGDVEATIRMAKGATSRSSTSETGVAMAPVRSKVQLCKLGCGRPVQPGLTRGGNQYDTCCKNCSRTGGKLADHEHDENCAGLSTAESTTLYTGPNPKEFLDDLAPNGAVARAYCKKIFDRISRGATEISGIAAWDAIQDLLLQTICHQLVIREQDRDRLTMQVKHKHSAGLRSIVGGESGMAKTANFTVDEFTELCTIVLEAKKRDWFPPPLQAMTRNFVRKSARAIGIVYDVGKKLGEGSFGEVYDVTHRISKERRVCKTIKKAMGKEGMRPAEIMAEINNMALLDHPGVIKVYEYFDESDCIIQIMEPCRGGELQDKIDAVHRHRTQAMYSEAFVCDIMKQLLRALAFMHNNRFIHKDLKPQNIMLVEPMQPEDTRASIKVIDFGLAELFSPDQKMSKEVGGTLLYMAPEVYRQEISFKVDIWSSGVILFQMITGAYPFIATWPLPPGKNLEWWQSETRRLVEKEAVEMAKNPQLSTVSPECIEVLQNMLQKKDRQRPDAGECLGKLWFSKYAETPPPLSVGITQCLEAYAAQPDLKKALFLLMAHSSTAPALQELRAVFTHFDSQNTGSLLVTVLRDVLRKSRLQPLAVERVLYALDRDGSGAVQWTEFTAAALCVANSTKECLVQAAFNILDQDGDERVTQADLLEVLAAPGDKNTWKRALPEQCQLLLRRPTLPSHFTWDMFKTAMTEHLACSSGDKLGAVS